VSGKEPLGSPLDLLVGSVALAVGLAVAADLGVGWPNTRALLGVLACVALLAGIGWAAMIADKDAGRRRSALAAAARGVWRGLRDVLWWGP
jgi:hypothetical protein